MRSLPAKNEKSVKFKIQECFLMQGMINIMQVQIKQQGFLNHTTLQQLPEMNWLLHDFFFFHV